MNGTAYKQGDTVRVTMVGKVMTTEDHYLSLQLAAGEAWIPKDHIESVEVIRSPLKVGDIISAHRLNTEDWPHGTVLEDAGFDFLIRATKGWVSAETGNAMFLYNDHKILYLPDSA